MIDDIVSLIGPLSKSLVFIGGSVVSLYIEQDDIEEFRPTDDVDAVIHVSTLMDYYDIDSKLKSLGFKNCTKKKSPICRYTHGELIFDLTPDDKNILGFSNTWYKEGVKSAIDATLTTGEKIKILSLPYFICTKIEAFNDRGGDDLLFSHDLEDITLILRGLKNPKSILSAPSEVEVHIRKFFRKIIREFEYIDYLFGEYPSTGKGVVEAGKLIDFLKSI